MHSSAAKISQPDFQKIFESAPGLYLILSPQLIIVGVSDAYTEATMTKREEIIGKGLFEVFPDNPDDKEADGVFNLKASLNYVMRNQDTHTMAVQKYDIRRPDGSFEERYWSPKNKPVIDEYGNVAFIIHRVEDVTGFILLQKEKALFSKLTDELKAQASELEVELFNSAQEIQKLNRELEQKVRERTIELESVNKTISDYKFALDESSIVAVTDQKGIIKNVNDNFCKISKYSREELIGKDHRIINSGHHPKEFIRNLWVTISKGKIWKGELKNKAKDGTIYWVDTTIVPFLDAAGKPYQYVAIRSDITQRKQGEEEILKLNDELEDKVTERTLELTQSLEREKQLSEMKSRFVSIASHEFRTPLSAILSSISLLEKYSGPEHADKREKHFSRIKTSVKNLTGILEDFLSLDKLEQGKTQVNNDVLDLKEYIETVKGEVDGMLKKGQAIKTQHVGETTVSIDKRVLHNILLNLLSNAIKYSPENGKIDVFSEVTNEKIVLKVTDTGIGIPEEEQKNLFKLFFRAKNAEFEQGTGLGLTIVKRYVEILNGSISFISSTNNGTCFTLEFPKQKQP